MNGFVKAQELREQSPLLCVLVAGTLWIISYFLLLPEIRHLGRFFLPESPLEESISFFLYEVPKVLLLLYAVVFVVGDFDTDLVLMRSTDNGVSWTSTVIQPFFQAMYDDATDSFPDLDGDGTSDRM